MKRSLVNEIINEGISYFAEHGWKLPVFAYWNIDEWKRSKEDTSLIKKLMIGWDVTDFGSGNYYEFGCLAYTIRNGIPNENLGVPYCEKLLYIREGQCLPLHFHFSKVEDIINRNGGVLVVKLYNSKEDKSIDFDSDINVRLDGCWHTFKAGSDIEIFEGSSITIDPQIYHLLYAKKEKGHIIAGEVSTTNDDNVDNHFVVEGARYSNIEEDEKLIYPLCNEYNQLL